jgi:hypothetical protein
MQRRGVKQSRYGFAFPRIDLFLGERHIWDDSIQEGEDIIDLEQPSEEGAFLEEITKGQCCFFVKIELLELMRHFSNNSLI